MQNISTEEITYLFWEVRSKLMALDAVVSSVQKNQMLLDDEIISSGKMIPVTIDLRGILHGPYNKADGRYVVVDVASGTVIQQPSGTVRPDNPSENEVWIDLNETSGRVYIPRLG